MVKTHLPAHMDSVRQKCRPKHQLLILKCYPRLPKNSTAEAKPNGSELSYLCYYASTRRSKLQKVGAFLERKTASDVSHAQSARVLVTLLILTALLDNKMVGAGSGFALIAPYILRIIREIIHSNDISLIEASTHTWDIFCHHQDQALLAADHEYRGLYEQVVRRYAEFAHKQGNKKLAGAAQPVAAHDQIRLRESGLQAIKSMLMSENLTGDSGRQLDTTMPAILSNIMGPDDRYLDRLVRLSRRNEDEEKKEKVSARRQSVTIIRTQTAVSEPTDPRQAEGTASDADKIAEESIAVLALSCLRSVFTTENRGQVRVATLAVLKYLGATKGGEYPSTGEKSQLASSNSSWATRLFELCTAWVPVQDRFISMLTAVETLVRLPLKDSDLHLHLLYTDMIDRVLRSELNLIGLSTMDLLLALVQQILRILHLSDSPNASRVSLPNGSSRTGAEQSQNPSTQLEARVRLTQRLRDCVSDLATHVYYTDQVADMIAAILLRLKPNPTPAALQNPLATAAAIEEPRAAVTEVASNVSVSARERSNSTSSFFSFETARCIALEAVRDILTVANSSRSLSSVGVAESRNKVPISIWEGTQWLLRDPHIPVRRAYVEALTTWLALETKQADFRIQEPLLRPKKPSDAVARRAVSNASMRNRGQSKKATSTFLQLLHLAVYENVIDYAATSESDMLVLHLLLSTLVRKLGVNALQGGMPMIFALQDDIPKMQSAEARLRSASLVHGYLWTIVETFNFDSSPAGCEIINEITRRKENRVWSEGIRLPPSLLDNIPASVGAGTEPTFDIGPETFHRFDDRSGLVERISVSYTAAIPSPPNSPPGSPVRGPVRHFTSTPKVERAGSSYLGVKPTDSGALELPDKIKDAMMESWSRESCLAAIAAAAPRSISLSGSRSSPSRALMTGNNQQILAAAAVTSPIRNPSLTPSQPLVVANYRQQAFGRRMHSQSPGRKGSMGASTHGPDSSSAGARGTLRVDDLKRALADGAIVGLTANISTTVAADLDDTGSESVADADETELHSESEPSTPAGFNDAPATAGAETATGDEPPVLNLPSDAVTGGRLAAASNRHSGQASGHVTVSNGANAPALRHAPAGDGRASVRSKTATLSKMDLRALLVDVGDEVEGAKPNGSLAGMSSPPY